MAKDNREPRPSKARILFGFAEVEGSDAAITENVRSLAAAVVRALQNPPATARIVKSLPAGNGKAKSAEEETLFTQVVEQPAESDIDDDADVLDAEPAPIADATPKAPRVPKKPPAYSFVKDLDLHPADKQHLKAFFAEKKPDDQMEKLVVCTYYLTHVLRLTGVGPNHLYHCFKEVEERVPADILQSVRNTKARRGWLDPEIPDDIKVTTPGENYVEHDLPPKTTS